MAILKGGVVQVQQEATGVIDGVNKDFTTSTPFVPGTLVVALNGLVLLNPDDYVEITNQSFQFVQAPIGGADPDRIVVLYQTA